MAQESTGTNRLTGEDVMAFTLHENTLAVRSHHAWVTWVVHGFFLLALPGAIWAMWTGQAPVPTWFSLVFTALFLVALPFLVSEIRRVRLVTALLDAASGDVHVVTRGVFRRGTLRRHFSDIDRLELRTTSGDGDFHTLLLVFRDGNAFEVAHGNRRKGMEEACSRLLAFLHRKRPDLAVTERRL